MQFPATLSTYVDILQAVHNKYTAAVKVDGELAIVSEKKTVIAGALLSLNVPLLALVGKYDGLIKEVAKFFASPAGYGSMGALPSLDLVRPVTLFKKECKTLADAADFGIVGVFAALIGENVEFVSPDSDDPKNGRYEDWDVPNRFEMSWAIPTLKARQMHENTASRGAEIVSFDAGGSDVDPDPSLTTDKAYISHMLYRRAVRRLVLSLSMCESIGYAITMLLGYGTPSSYYTTDEEDFLPMDVVDRMNKVMHFDPPTGYLRGPKGLFFGYHSNAGIIPSLKDLCSAEVLSSSDLTPSVRDQLSAWYEDPAPKSERKWISLVAPLSTNAVRDASKVAIDFAIQHLLARVGALTPGSDAKHRWHRYYVRLDYSYALLLRDHLAVRGIVVENGVFSAYLTRFVITRDADTGPVSASFTVFADRGYLTDGSALLGNPTIEIDGTKYKIEYTYLSEWIPAGPGLTAGDLDVGDDPTTVVPALEPVMGTESRFSTYAAYVVTIKEEVKK